MTCVIWTLLPPFIYLFFLETRSLVQDCVDQGSIELIETYLPTSASRVVCHHAILFRLVCEGALDSAVAVLLD